MSVCCYSKVVRCRMGPCVAAAGWLTDVCIPCVATGGWANAGSVAVFLYGRKHGHGMLNVTQSDAACWWPNERCVPVVLLMGCLLMDVSVCCY